MFEIVCAGMVSLVQTVFDQTKFDQQAVERAESMNEQGEFFGDLDLQTVVEHLQTFSNQPAILDKGLLETFDEQSELNIEKVTAVHQPINQPDEGPGQRHLESEFNLDNLFDDVELQAAVEHLQTISNQQAIPDEDLLETFDEQDKLNIENEPAVHQPINQPDEAPGQSHLESVIDKENDNDENANQFDTAMPEHNYSKLDCVTNLFTHKLLLPPRRERSSRKCRPSAPSYNLTGDEHFAFINEKIAKKSKVAEKKPRKMKSVAGTSIEAKAKQVRTKKIRSRSTALIVAEAQDTPAEKESKAPNVKRGTKNMRENKNPAANLVGAKVTSLRKISKTTSVQAMEKKLGQKTTNPRRPKTAEKKLTRDVQSPCDPNYTCTHCGGVYASPDDPKKSEEWWPCKTCGIYLHESCAQNTGLLDDDDCFLCMNCL